LFVTLLAGQHSPANMLIDRRLGLRICRTFPARRGRRNLMLENPYMEIRPLKERHMRRFALIVLALESVPSMPPVSAQTPAAPTAELDSFMQQVLARRDDNWKKIQQYIFDEQERTEFRGPGEALVWGEKREYVWYPREGTSAEPRI
jgi:hypothetical protein